MCSHPMGLLDDRLRIIDVSAAEDYMGDRHQERGFIDSIEQPLGRDGNAIIRLHHVDASAILLLCFPEIHD